MSQEGVADKWVICYEESGSAYYFPRVYRPACRLSGQWASSIANACLYHTEEEARRDFAWLEKRCRLGSLAVGLVLTSTEFPATP